MSQNLLTLAVAFIANESVKTEKMVRALVLALVAQKNAIFFGPGGHDKSRVARLLVRDFLGLPAPVKTFGGGTTEESLFGGMDLAELRKSGRQKFLFGGIWMDQEATIWEEFLDAPARVLTSLKNTLTAGRYEADRLEDCYPQAGEMVCRTIIGLTNLEPAQVADQGADVEALVQRFPIQMRVAWDSYLASDFAELFAVVRNGTRVVADHATAQRLLREAQERAGKVNLNAMEGILAEMMAKAREQSEISPRTAVHALGLVAASAAIAGRTEATKEDLLVLEFLPGMEAFAANIKTELDAAVARAEAEAKLVQAETRMRELLVEAAAANTPISALQAKKRLTAFADAVSALTVTDGLVERRKKLRESIDAKVAEMGKRADDLVRIYTHPVMRFPKILR